MYSKNDSRIESLAIELRGGQTRGWVSQRRSSSTVRRYWCTACGELIDTESAGWRQTVHAREAITDHLVGCEAIADLRRRARAILAARSTVVTAGAKGGI